MIRSARDRDSYPEESLNNLAGGRATMSMLMWSKARRFAMVAAGLWIAASVRAEDQRPLQRVATIELNGKPGTLDHLSADWKNSRLFVANQSNDTLDVVDVKNNKLVKQISGQKQIH